MTYLSDTLTVGLVLVLLFGSIALYLYTRIQQSEQKVSLLETILLDMKMSSEIKSYTELPADELFEHSHSPSKTPPHPPTPQPSEVYEPFEDVQINLDECEDLTPENVENMEVQPDVENYRSMIRDALTEGSEKSYDSMTVKELQALAKSRGLSAAAKKGQLIESLKLYDSKQDGVSGSNSVTGSSTFLETSASVSDELV
jgi:hypothetical protein